MQCNEKHMLRDGFRLFLNKIKINNQISNDDAFKQEYQWGLSK